MAISRDVFKDWNVLVIDDDPDCLEVAQRILLHHGANVITAVNGKEGLDVIKSTPLQFVISDISMPTMDGWELIYNVKHNRDTNQLPMIALTAHAMSRDRERVLEAGFDNYMSKPLITSTFIPNLITMLKEIPQLADQLN